MLMVVSLLLNTFGFTGADAWTRQNRLMSAEAIDFDLESDGFDTDDKADGLELDDGLVDLTVGDLDKADLSISQNLASNTASGDNTYVYQLTGQTRLLLSDLVEELALPVKEMKFVQNVSLLGNEQDPTIDMSLFVSVVAMDEDFLFYIKPLFAEARLNVYTDTGMFTLRLVNDPNLTLEEVRLAALELSENPSAFEPLFSYDFDYEPAAIRLSRVLEAVGLSIKGKNVEEVGVVEQTGDEGNILDIEAVKDDYKLTAKRGFSEIELAVFTANDIYTISLLNGRAVGSGEGAEGQEQTEVGVSAHGDSEERDIDLAHGSSVDVSGAPGLDLGDNTGAGIEIEQIQEPVSEPVVEQPQTPATEPETEPGGESAIEQIQQPASEPETEPGSEPWTEPGSESAIEQIQQPASEPENEPETEPGDEQGEDQSITVPEAEPVAEPATEPGIESGTESAIEQIQQPVSEPENEQVETPASEPGEQGEDQTITEPTEPGVEPGEEQSITVPEVEPGTEPATEPGTESGSESAIEQIQQPVSEPEIEQVETPASEPGDEPSEDQSITVPETEPITEPTEPGDEPSEDQSITVPEAEPGTEPTEPGDESSEDQSITVPETEPGTEPTEPGDEQGEDQTTTEPTEDQEGEPETEPATEPETGSTEPGDEQDGDQSITEPATEPVEEPSTEPTEDQEGEPATEPETEPTEPGDEPGEDQITTEPSENQEGEPETEPTEPGDEPGEDQSITEPGTEPAEEPATEPEEAPVAYPAVTFSARASGVTVDVTADEGAFPEGTTMTVRRVWDADTLSDIRESVADDFTRVRRVQAVDIAFYNKDGVEIEPLIPISVVISVSEINDGQSAMVVHMDDEGQTEVVTQSDAGSADGKTNLNMEMPAGEGAQTEVGEDAAPDSDGTMPAVGDGVDASQPSSDTSAEAGEGGAADEAAPESDDTMPSIEDGVDVPDSDAMPALEDAAPASNQTEVSFEAGAFSLYAVVVTEIISTHYIAANGDTYYIEVGYGPDAGIPSGAALSVSELPEGTEAYDSYVQMTAETLETEPEHLAFAHAFDISIVDPDSGEKYQPVQPVSVSVKLLKEDVSEAGAVNVVHFPEDEAGNADEGEILETSMKGEAIQFETDGFSVYVVVEGVPTLQYRFVKPNGDEYSQYRQTMQVGDPLIEPQPPTDDGKVFVKWVAVDDPTKPASAQSDAFTGWRIINAEDIPIPAEGESYPIKRYLKAVFEQDVAQVKVSYHDQSGKIIRTDVVDSGSTVDSTAVSYTAQQMSTGEFLVFRYWTHDLYDLPNGEPIDFGSQSVDQDMDLYPYCSEAHWLYFDGNARTNPSDTTRPESAPYIAPELVIPGSNPPFPTSVHVPSVKGFTFLGWFSYAGDKIYDETGNLVSVEAFRNAFITNNLENVDTLDYNPTLQAHWEPETTAEYTVAYYVLKADANVNDQRTDSDYYYLKTADTRTADVGQTVSYNSGLDTLDAAFSDIAQEEGSQYANYEKKFVFNSDNPLNTAGVKVSAGGTTVLKVYFDRIVYTMRFYNNTRASGNLVKTITNYYGASIRDQFPILPNYPGTSWKDEDLSTLKQIFVAQDTMPVLNNTPEDIVRDGNEIASGKKIYYYRELVDYGEYNDNDNIILNGVAAKKYAQFNNKKFELFKVALSNFNFLTFEEEFSDINGFKQFGAQPAFDKLEEGGRTTSGTTYNGGYYLYYTRREYNLNLRYRLDDVPGSATATSKLKYGEALTDEKLKALSADTFNLSNVENYKDKSWWYYDDTCKTEVEFTDLTMPAYDLNLYEGVRTRYAVQVDADGGVLEGGKSGNGSTWFTLDKGELMSEYNVIREYVLAAEVVGDPTSLTTAYKYIYYPYGQRNSEGNKPAIYKELTADELASLQSDGTFTPDDADPEHEYYVSNEAYVYYPGMYTFQYWYKVTATFDGQRFIADEKPSDSASAYNFGLAIKAPVLIKAKWQREGSYSVVYDAGAAIAPVDHEQYVYGADVVVKTPVDHPSGKQFRFWKANTGESYLPNSTLTVTSDLTEDATPYTIVLTAEYEDGEFSTSDVAEYDFYVSNADGVTWPDGDDDLPYYVERISAGEVLVIPQTPSDPMNQSRAFTGWYLDRECTQRFEGFGVIGTPMNRKLYAGFSMIYTVTYYEPKLDSDGNVVEGQHGDRVITQQTYIDGERLNTVGVEYITTSDRYVKNWTDGTEEYTYNAKGDTFGKQITEPNIVLWPVVGEIYTVRFDAQGGSYVAPVTFPTADGHWLPLPISTRDGYTLDGWYTEKEGGVKYAFNAPIKEWADNNNSGVVPTILYAHWNRNSSEAIYTTLTINYWVENADKNGYSLYKAVTVDHVPVGGPYALNDGQKALSNMAGYYTFASDNNGTNPDDQSAGYFKLKDDADARAEWSTDSVADGGTTQLNVYFDRKTYTLVFQPDNIYTDSEIVGKNGERLGIWRWSDNTQTVTYSIDGKFTVSSGITTESNGTYKITAWLGRDTSALWPGENVISEVSHTDSSKSYLTLSFRSVDHKGKDHSGDSTPGKVQDSDWSINPKGYEWYTPWTGDGNGGHIWGNGYDFTGWTEDNGSTFVNRRDRQSTIGRQLIPQPKTVSTYTLTAQYKAYETANATSSGANDNAVYVRYFLLDNNGQNPIEQPQLQQTVYGVTGTGEGAAWRPSDWSKITDNKADIVGYHYVDSAKTGLKVNGGSNVYTYRYIYKMPDDQEYEHYAAAGWFGIDLWSRPEDFKDIYLKVGDQYLGYGEVASTAILEGKYDIYYLDSSYKEHTSGAIYAHATGTTPSSSTVTGMGIAAFKSIIDVAIDPSAQDADQFTAAHPYKKLDPTATTYVTVNTPTYYVNLYYIANDSTLSLYNGAYKDLSDGTLVAAAAAPFATPSVPYTTYLTNTDGTKGYIHDGIDGGAITGLNVPEGYQFAFWSTSPDGNAPFEGPMPNSDMALYAHYELQSVKVKSLGVNAEGQLRRYDSGEQAGEIMRDDNDVPLSWEVSGGGGLDYSSTKLVGTPLAEFELPVPQRGSDEIFQGWKRVLADGTLSSGFITNSTIINTETVVAPYIVVNRSGKITYDANGGEPEIEPKNASVGPYYLGSTTKVAAGTNDLKPTGETPLTKDGKAFVCWNTQPDGLGVNYYPGDEIAMPDSGDEIKLYAKYAEDREVTLTYHLNDPESPVTAEFTKIGEQDVATTEINGETVVQITFEDYSTTNPNKFPNVDYPANTDANGNGFMPTKPGMSFRAWNTKQDGSGTDILSADTIRVNTLQGDGKNYELWAQWEEVMLPVTVYVVQNGDYTTAEQRKTLPGKDAFIKWDGWWSDTAEKTANELYDAYDRNGLTKGENGTTHYFLLNAYLSTDDPTDDSVKPIGQVQFDAWNGSKWKYMREDSWSAEDFGVAGLKLYYARAVCKINNYGSVHVFATLKAAVDYAENKMYTGEYNQATIEMIVPRYVMPAEDAVTIAQNKYITIKTAASDATDGYPYLGTEGGKATIVRGFDGQSMFTNNGSLTLNDIILDGGSESGRVANDDVVTGLTGKGGLVNVNANGARLNVNAGAVLQNSTTESEFGGGAIYLATGATLNMAGVIEGCTAPLGGGVSASQNATVTLSGSAAIRNNTATNYGAGIALAANSDGSPTTTRVNVQDSPVVYDNKVGDDQNNLYFDEDRSDIIQLTGALTADAHIGVYTGDSAFDGHGKQTMPFAAHNGNTDNLGAFQNDRTPAFLGSVGRRAEEQTNRLAVWGCTFDFSIVVRWLNDDLNKIDAPSGAEVTVQVVDAGDTVFAEIEFPVNAAWSDKAVSLPILDEDGNKRQYHLVVKADSVAPEDYAQCALAAYAGMKGTQGNPIVFEGEDNAVNNESSDNGQWAYVYLYDTKTDFTVIKNWENVDASAQLQSYFELYKVPKGSVTGARDLPIGLRMDNPPEYWDQLPLTTTDNSWNFVATPTDKFFSVASQPGEWYVVTEEHHYNRVDLLPPEDIDRWAENGDSVVIRFRMFYDEDRGDFIPNPNSTSTQDKMLKADGTPFALGDVIHLSGDDGGYYVLNRQDLETSNFEIRPDGTHWIDTSKWYKLEGFDSSRPTVIIDYTTQDDPETGATTENGRLGNVAEQYTDGSDSDGYYMIPKGASDGLTGRREFTDLSSDYYYYAVEKQVKEYENGGWQVKSLSTDYIPTYKYEQDQHRVTITNTSQQQTEIVCKLTDADNHLLYKDAAHTQPAVYGTLAAGFAAADDDLYDSNGDPVDSADAVKIKVLKDITLGEGISFTSGRENLILTTAEDSLDADTLDTGDTYIFTTDRDEDTDRGQIVRGYNDGSLFYSDGTFTLTNIVLDGDKDGDITGEERTGGNGGLVNVASGTLNIQTDALLQNSFANIYGNRNGGGAVYSKNDQNPTTINMSGGEIKNCASVQYGGGIYMNYGTVNFTGGVIRNCFVDARQCSDVFMATEGGGIKVDGTDDPNGDQSAELTMSGDATIVGCESRGNVNHNGVGGAIHLYHVNSETAIRGGTIQNNTACSAGGGIYQNGGSVDIDGANISGCTVEGGDTSDQDRYGNGGGIYIEAGTLSIGTGTEIIDCSAHNYGGAVYANDDTTVYFLGGSETDGDGNPVPGVNISGCSSADGGAVNVGGVNSKLYFEGNTVVYNNLDGTQQKNVVLDQDSNGVIRTTENGLGEGAHIGVYVTGDASDGHGGKGDDFGTYDDTQTTVTTNEGETTVVKGAQYLYRFTNDIYGYAGEVDPKNDYLIRWQGYVCKITVNDGGANQGKLLYFKDHHNISEAVFTDLQAAFDALDGNHLYTDEACTNANRYDPGATGKAVKIEMLVANYELPKTASIDADQDAHVTLTTASTSGSYPYTGDADVPATIKRGSCTTWMFHINDNDMDLTLENITIDGEEVEVTGKNYHGGGALIHMHHGTVTMGSQSTLKNGVAQTYGGAVYATYGTQFIMSGGTISNCSAGVSGGAIHLDHDGKPSFTMSDGKITGCKAPAGSAIYLVSHSHNAHSAFANFSGGEISGNTLTVSDGGSVQMDNPAYNCKLNFSGNPVIYDNKNSEDKQANVYLAQNNLEIINVVDTLTGKAKIGVWPTQGENQDEDDPFGSTVEAGANAMLYGFINDYHQDHNSAEKKLLVGTPGSNGEVIWKKVICKIVDSDQVEHVFPTLNSAITHSKSNAKDYVTVGSGDDAVNVCTIQMLVDYEMPAADVVSLNTTTKADNIVLTTAPTSTATQAFEGEKFFYTGTGDKATIKRGSDNKASMFTVGAGASLTTQNIILDGGAAYTKYDLDGIAENEKDGFVSGVTVTGDLNLNGGIVSVSGTMTVNFDTTFCNTAVKAGYSGGAIYVNGGTLTVSGGKTVNAGTENEKTVSSVLFKDCYANTSGGAIYTAQSNLTIAYATFERCASKAGGGAIRHEQTADGSVTTLNYCKFDTCYSTLGSNGDSGAAMLTKTAEVYLTGCEFLHGRAFFQAGGMFHNSKGAGGNSNKGTVFYASDCTFSDCISGFKNKKSDQGSGGGLETKAESMTMMRCTFEDCVSRNNGGAVNVYNTNSIISATGCEFTRCRTYLNASNGMGGGLRNNGTETTITDCTFDSCEAKSGGALFCNGNKTIVNGTTVFENCYASVTGGGIYQNTGKLYLEGNTTDSDNKPVYMLNNCHAPNGGGIYQGSGTCHFNSGSIYLCYATTSGGGVYLGKGTFNVPGDNSPAATAGTTFPGGTITECYATTSGGGVYLGGSGTGNSNKSEVKLSGGSIIGCYAPNGGGVYVMHNNNNATMTISKNGDAVTGCKARTVTISSEGIPSANNASTSGQYGGGVYLGGGILKITNKNAAIHSCEAWEGGGIYLGGTNSTLEISGKIGSLEQGKENKAVNGGGIYQAGGTLTINSTANIISNKATSGNGGGIYLGGGTMTINSGAQVKGNSATGGNGGGIYLGGSGGKLYLYSSIGGTGKDDGNSAKNGGGIYQADGTMTIGSGVDVVGNTANNGNGGGIDLGGGTMTIGSNVDILNNTANNGNGGGVNLGGGTMTISSGATIKGNEATATAPYANDGKAGNGGGIYLGAAEGVTSKLTLNGEIGGTGDNDGNKAVNGGGIFQMGGTLEINGGNITGNVATAFQEEGGFGGGIYLGGGTFTLNDGVVGVANSGSDAVTYAQSEKGNKAVDGGGLYVADGVQVSILGGKISGNRVTGLGGGIATGGAESRLYFAGSIQVFDNFLPQEDGKDVRCDVCLDYDSNKIINTTAPGLNEESHIGVYVTNKDEDENGDPILDDDGDPTTLYEKHGKGGKPFGTFVQGNKQYDSSLDRFINNRSGDRYESYDYYYGVRKTTKDDPKIYWAEYICKITDGEGNLLFTNRRATAPALYQYLGKDGAFEALGKVQQFYVKTGENTTAEATPVYVKMLIDEYSLKWEDAVTWEEDGVDTITLTVADIDDPDYIGDRGEWDGGCVIKRGECKGPMFKTENSSTSFTLKNITLDGESYDEETSSYIEDKAIQASGGLVNACGQLILDGATLKNAYVKDNKYNGGAVAFSGSGSLTMRNNSIEGGTVTFNEQTYTIAAKSYTAKIEHCKSANGAVLAVNAAGVNVTFAMDSSAQISNCEATNGLVYVKNGTLNLGTAGGNDCALNGNTDTSDTTRNVIGCTSANGGVAYVAGGTLNLNGSIAHFSATNGGAAYLNSATGTMNLNGSVESCTATSNGGAVYVNSGTFIMEDVNATDDKIPSIKNCQAQLGGAIFAGNATVNLSAGEISGNVATGSGGGAIRLEDNNCKVNVSGTAVISGNKASDTGNGQRYGGAINIKKGTLRISGGTISGNYVETKGNGYGGAISAGDKLYITGGTISGNYVKSTDNAVNGGAISVDGANTVAEISGCTITGNYVQTMKSNKDSRGGAIFVTNGATTTISGGTICANEAKDVSFKSLGGAIYVDDKSTVKISGAPDFGGTGTTENGELYYLESTTVSGKTIYRRCYDDEDGNTNYPDDFYYLIENGNVYLVDESAAYLNTHKETVDGVEVTVGDPVKGGIPIGNFVNKTGFGDKTNGGKAYSESRPATNPKTYFVRQDIYLAEASENDPKTLVVAGDLTGEKGSIWVWAESEHHYKQLTPFARLGDAFYDEGTLKEEYSANNGAALETMLSVFRNAQDDETTENGTDTFLFGTSEGDNPGLVYWTGVGGMRKVILRKVVEPYTSAERREFAIYKGTSTTAYKPKGETDLLSGLTSGDSGCFWIGTLPYGWYILKEGETDPARWFYLIVDDSGVYCTLDLSDKTVVGGYGTRAEAEAAAKAKADSIKAAKQSAA